MTTSSVAHFPATARAPANPPDSGKFSITAAQMIEQAAVDALIKESYRLDPSIKDFLIHEDDVVRIVCARGTKKITELFEPNDEHAASAMGNPLSRNSILYFVLVNLMGARTKEELANRRAELSKTLEQKGCYNGSTRLSWGTTVRVTLFHQGRLKLAIVGRVASLLIPPIDQIGLPYQVVSVLKSARSGLVLITGPMSAGKTRTAQTLMNHRNMAGSGHIITIEDPIETDLKSGKCLVTTKEVGLDTASFADGLRDALRQAADILCIGEMRDKETVKAAINASGSGLLVIATVHGDTCAMALTRMMSLLGDEAAGYWGVLSQSLLCVLRQALIPAADGASWVMAADAVLNRTGSKIGEILDKGDLKTLATFTGAGSKSDGKCDDWISMNDALTVLVASKKITPEAARRASTYAKGLMA